MVSLKKNSCGVLGVDNRCHFCRKIFCCSECRDAHEGNKHAELNSSKPKCLLCFKYDLPYDPRLNSADTYDNNFDGAQLVCHVVINHLPVRCKICGERYDSAQAFQSAKPCKGPIKKQQPPQRASLARRAVAQALAARSPLIGGLPCDEANSTAEDLVATPDEQKLPLTPQYHIEASATCSAKSRSLLIKNPILENFDSPLELARHTSTPMHLSVAKKQHSHPPSVPDFDLKTPSSSSQRTFDTIGSAGSTYWGSAISAYESKYYTADLDGRILRLSLEASNNSSSAQRENQSSPNWTSPVYPILKKQLDRQDSSDESPTSGTNYRVERGLLKSALLGRIDESCQRDSIEKRVRFSDQFAPSPPSTSTNATMADNSAYDNDIFFEARESLDDDGEQEAEANSPIVVADLKPKKLESLVDNAVGESKANVSAITTSSTTTSSRVLMMLLVEKTDDAKGFSSLDLTPLIDTGLKKLEESAAASMNNSKAESANRGDASSGAIATTTEITSYTREIDGSLTETSRGCRRRASIKDTFVTMTDRIECITPPPRRRERSNDDDATAEARERELANKADSLINGAGACAPKSDGGLLSAMARAVRSALKKLPAAVTARNLSREPTPPPNSNSLPVVVASPVAAAATVDSHAATTALVRRSSIKRPRERIDSHDEAATPRDSPGSNDSAGRSSSSSSSSTRAHNNSSSSTSNNNNELVVKSPAAKRHRGWYRIRAREPIARMRERQVAVASPRGASRETQRFQQGALSIGDTFLPLPSRAHQSTQTED